MKQIFSTITIAFLLIMGFTIQASAVQEMNPKTVQRLDRKMTKKQAHRKRFRTHKEYLSMKKISRSMRKNAAKHHRRANDIFARPNRRVAAQKYARESRYDDWNHALGPRQRGYNHFKRGWYLAYRYDRAVFYDQYGYEYGYFNRNGFYFDGIFYSYDRYYRYQDRLRGRGLFGRKYYMPADAAYYGFCHNKRRTYPMPL